MITRTQRLLVFPVLRLIGGKDSMRSLEADETDIATSIDWSDFGSPVEPRSIPEARMYAEMGLILRKTSK